MAEKTRVLFLAANPRDLNQLRLDVEARDIRDRVRAAEFRDGFEFVTRWAVRTNDLLQAFNEVRPHVVHFSGHGNAAELAFEDAAGNYKPVGEPALAGLMRAAADTARLVVLNACESDRLARAMSKQVDCAVGMSETIGNAAAVAFAASFYGALAFGRSVGQAFDQGRTQLMLDGIPEEDTPALHARDGVDPLGVHLVQRAQANPVLPPLALEIARAAADGNTPINFARSDMGAVILAGGRQFGDGYGYEHAARLEDALVALSRTGWIASNGGGQYRLTAAAYDAVRGLPAPPAGSFTEVARRVPDLVREMKADLARRPLVREFFALEDRQVMLGGSSKPRFTYFESEHPDLRGALDALENEGYLVDVTPKGTPIYRMTEEFVRLVQAFE